MSNHDDPPAVVRAGDAPKRVKASNYPEPFASRMAGRVKQPLGDLFGVASFGVNLTTLEPGGVSALHHSHTVQDEFVYVVEGEITLHLGDETHLMRPGDCAGFPANGPAHHLENRSAVPARYLEIGDRRPGDEGRYPADDIMAAMVDGRWRFTRKDGTPY